jgi:glycosyltransferase involved in cell wall biosynthesis
VALKIAYDITVLGQYFDRPDAKSGIYRVVEEILNQALDRNDIELSLIGLCEGHVLFNSMNSYSYHQSRNDSENLEFKRTFKSRLGLSDIYWSYLNNHANEKLKRIPKFSLESLFIKMIRKVLMKTCSRDIIPSFETRGLDLFHSTYYKLPPEELTKNLPRLITIYDLIPVTAPGFVTTFQTSLFKSILESININKDWSICISEYSRHEFCEYTKMPLERTFIAPLAAADHFYPVQDSSRIAEVCHRYSIKGDYFLSLAAPQPRKNMSLLIRCFFRLLQENKSLDINLVLVGSRKMGWMNDEIYSTAHEIPKFSSRIIFTDYIPDSELSEIYSGATAFVFPSLYEGFGLPVLEAMKCGTPVITSNTTSLPEVAGDAAILIDPLNEDELCQAMLDLIKDSQLRQELTQRGLSRSNQFSWKKCADDTFNAYATIVNSQ